MKRLAILDAVLFILVASCMSPPASVESTLPPVATAEPQIRSDLFPLSPNYRVAFISDRDGNADLYLMEMDGGNQSRIIESEAAEQHPIQSPDGKYLAYSRCSPSGVMHWCATSYLLVLDTHTGPETVVAEWKRDRGMNDVCSDPQKLDRYDSSSNSPPRRDGGRADE